MFSLRNQEFRLKFVFRLLLAIAFSGPGGHVVMAEEVSLRIVSLEERLETLRHGLDEGGHLECGTSDVPKRAHYDSCSKLHSLSDQGCFAYTTADMGNQLGYERLCEEIPLLEKAHSPTVEYFDVDSPGWWKLLPASMVPNATDFSEEPIDRSAVWESFKSKALGEFDIAETYSHSGKIAIILDKWKDKSDGEYSCGEYRDLFIMRLGVLVDFDGDGVAELRIHGSRNYVSDCLMGSMEAISSGFAITLEKTSSDGPVRRLD